MGIEILGLTKRFGDFTALQDVSLRIADGKLVALLGPSGSGKTTLLRIIAGLEWPDAGDLRLSGDPALERSARERRVGLVFQHYALFRHMTVLDNVAFGLRVMPRRDRPPKAEIERRARALLDLVQIGQLAGRYPNQLSGGQRQRVALARSLATAPRVLLLDEPFGALDAKVRKELRRWLRRLHNELGMTTVFVTHDQEEAFELADHVVIMNNGRVEQEGTPAEIYARPANPFVFEFLGDVNRLPVGLRGGQVDLPEIAVAALDGEIEGDDGPATLYVRPHEVELMAQANGPGVVRHVSVTGPAMRVEVDMAHLDCTIESLVALPRWHSAGIAVGSRVRPRFIRGHVFRDPAGPVRASASAPDLRRTAATL